MKFAVSSQTAAVMTTVAFSLLISVILAQSASEGSTLKSAITQTPSTNLSAAKVPSSGGSGPKPSDNSPDSSAITMTPLVTMEVTTTNKTDNGSWILRSNWFLTTVCGVTFLLVAASA